MRKLILILVALLALVNSSCERRELVELSNTHYVRVYINEDIQNVTSGLHENIQTPPKYKSPQILRLLLADPQTGKVRAERFLRTKSSDERGTYYEGYIVADPGNYRLIAYNFDTEVCIVRNYTDFNNSMVYTNEIATHLKTKISKAARRVIQKEMQREMQKVAQKSKALSTRADDDRGEDRIVYAPDIFFLANYENVYVPYSDVLDTLKTRDKDFFTAESLVETYYLEIPVKGIELATSSVGLVSGMAGSAWLGTASINEYDPVALYLELQPGGDNEAGVVRAKGETDAEGEEKSTAVMYTTFNTFGKLPDMDSRLTITFDFLTVHGGSYTAAVDITPEFLDAHQNGTRHITVGEDKLIDIEVVEPGPGGGSAGGGGFKPTVGTWEDVQTEIIM